MLVVVLLTIAFASDVEATTAATLECIGRLSFDCFDIDADGFISFGPLEYRPQYFPAPPVFDRYDRDGDMRLNRTEFLLFQRDPDYASYVLVKVCPGLGAEFCRTRNETYSWPYVIA